MQKVSLESLILSEGRCGREQSKLCLFSSLSSNIEPLVSLLLQLQKGPPACLAVSAHKPQNLQLLFHQSLLHTSSRSWCIFLSSFPRDYINIRCLNLELRDDLLMCCFPSVVLLTVISTTFAASMFTIASMALLFAI